LFRAASQALLKLAQDPRFCGGLIGMVGVLHTWTRRHHKKTSLTGWLLLFSGSA
jgi:hypothetical protein